MSDAKAKILASIIITSEGCWEWQKYKMLNGYGIFSTYSKRMLAHRASYTIFNGPIPTGLLVCHKCDKRDCVNPEHLFIGTQKDNIQDMLSKNRVSRVSRSVGSKHGRAVLDEDKVVQIRHKFYEQTHTISELGRLFGVNRNIIDRVVKRKTWRHI